MGASYLLEKCHVSAGQLHQHQRHVLSSGDTNKEEAGSVRRDDMVTRGVFIYLYRDIYTHIRVYKHTYV